MTYRIPGALLALTTIALLMACVPLTAEVPQRTDLFAPLHDRQLSTFEYGIATDRFSGNEDLWTETAQAFLDLAVCREPTEASAELISNPSIHLLHQLVIIEDRRRMRLIEVSRDGGNRHWHRGTIHSKFTSNEYFNRSPEPLDSDLIRWPESTDTWADERPAPREIPFDCVELGERELAESLSGPLAELQVSAVAQRMLEEWHQTQIALSILDEIDADQGDSLEITRQARAALTVHRGDLAILILQRDEIRDAAPDILQDLAERALDDLLQSPSLEDTSRLHLTDHGLALRIADLAIQLEDPDAALDGLAILRDHPNESVAESADYLHLKIAWMQGWWDVAAEGAPSLLDQGSRFHSAHAYFAATSHRHMGADDKFLGLAREALHDRPRGIDDPFMGALYREVLRELARYDVDERTDEILEELGPRSRLPERRRELAEVALDLGRPEVARDLVEPYLDDVQDARQIPRMQAILALAAFLSDDQPAFTAHIDALSRRPAGLQELIPRSRRATFFAHQDTELARVLRAMLPLMAEWGDDPPARAMRQIWLSTIVDHTQRFLRWAPESSVSDSLTELYQLAGQLLDDHPRGYAQRVGAEEPSASALVLGTVELTTAPPIEDAPHPRLRWPPLDSLLLIPLDGVPPKSYVHDVGIIDPETTP